MCVAVGSTPPSADGPGIDAPTPEELKLVEDRMLLSFIWPAQNEELMAQLLDGEGGALCAALAADGWGDGDEHLPGGEDAGGHGGDEGERRGQQRATPERTRTLRPL